MFGHLTPPDRTEDTLEQEVLNLFAEPTPPGAPLPSPRTAGAEARGSHRPRRPRRAWSGRLAGLLVCAVAAGAGSLAVLYGVPGAQDSDRLVAVDGERVVAPVPSAAGMSEAPAPEPTPTVSVPAPPPTTAPPAVRAQSPSASPGAVTPAPPASPSTPPPPPPPSSPPPPTPPPPSPPVRQPDIPPVLTLGSTGPEVAELQRRLERLHLYHGAYDGEYDQDVAVAVHRFQWIRNIDEPAGVYGPATRAALRAETGTARRSA
ncbi:peptidoglycan-binding protein [Streptomyces sp. NPDC059452]|uniref:peptidoglycan-binding domain-containing protein n=1 Tax=Streptomyces sp. NPDC059452 TaxID=3346835 RepID=UPI003687B951